MHVLMVDDHVMFLQGLKTLLSVLAPELHVDTCDSLELAVPKVQRLAYDLVLLDWHLAECDGLASLTRLREAGSVARIVVLSGVTSAELIRTAVELGAAGFIPKTYSSEHMISALNRVLTGQVFLPAEVLRSSHDPVKPHHGKALDMRFGNLTTRQVEVYRAAMKGLPNKLIARELGIAESTVKSHLSAVYGLLGVRNRTEAAYQASHDGTTIA
jgi:DNA-binding NarL/FixJ family response regulator